MNTENQISNSEISINISTNIKEKTLVEENSIEKNIINNNLNTKTISRKSSSSDLNEDYNFYQRRFSAVNFPPNLNKENFVNFSNPNNLEKDIDNYNNNNKEKYLENHKSFTSENNQTPQSCLSANNINSNSQVNYNQIISNLKLKIQILANAVKEERTKINELDSQNKNLKTSIVHYESLLNEKEDMIVSLTKEKYDLQTQYNKEKQYFENSNSNLSFTNLIGNIFNRRESTVENNANNDIEYKKLLNENIDLSHENDLLRKRIEDTTEDFNKCKSEYQNIINSQNEKLKRMENILQEKNLSIDEMQKKLQIMFENHKKYDVEKTNYESSLNQISKDNRLREEKIIELLLKLEDKENLISSYKESLQRHEIESAELARKLAELKNAIIESNLVITHFQGEKIGTFFNDSLELIFGRTEENEYVMIMKDKNGEEYIDLQDIDYIKLSDKYEDALDICYLVRIYF